MASAETFLAPIDLSGFELLNARLQNLGSTPGSGAAGRVYYHTGTNPGPYVHNGSAYARLAWASDIITAHSGLSGLSADDHTQYALLAGRSGGQTLYGGTGASNGLVLASTSNGTKGTVTLGNGTAYSLQLNESTGYLTYLDSTGLQVVQLRNDAIGGGNSSNPIIRIADDNLGSADTFYLLGNGNVYTRGTISGTQLISRVSTGTAPLTVTSTTKVSNLNVDQVDGAHASATPTASYIPIADGSNKLASGWISEVIATTDLSDVSAKTGSGTTIVMSSNPTLAGATFSADLAMGNNKITGLANGVSSTDAATVGQLNAIAYGMDWKGSVRIATTSIGSGTYTATNGTSARGQLTGMSNAAIDGVTPTAGDRVLVMTGGAVSGIWVITTLGSGANGVWDRAVDFDADAEVTAGAAVFVSEGTTYGNTSWYLTTDDPITIGGASGTSLTFAQTSGPGSYTAGTGLTLSGTQFALTGQALALHNLSSNGIIARTGSGTVATRTITASTGISTITNGDGVSGNPTIAVSTALQSVHTTTNTGTAGMLVVTAADTVTVRTLGAGTGLSWTNPTGAAGAPSIALSTALQNVHTKVSDSTGTTAAGFLVKTAADTVTTRQFVAGTNVALSSTDAASANITISLTGQVAVANGGTGLATVSTGGLLYGNGTSNMGVLSAGTATQILIGGASAPSWGALNVSTMVTGTLAVGNGGTGTASSPTQGGVIYATSTSAYASTAAGTSGQMLSSNGTSAPTWIDADLRNMPLSWVKEKVYVATTANITLSGTQTIDGNALFGGERVLVKNQTTTSQNGIYLVNAGGAWSRSTDADSTLEVPGAMVSVQDGTTNGGKVFKNSFKVSGTLGSTTMVWSEVVDVDTTQSITNKTFGSGNTWNGNSVGVAYGGTGTNTLASGGVVIGQGTSAVVTATGSSTQVLIGGTTPAFGAVNLTSMVTGTLPVGNGGTGQANPTANSLLIGNGSSAMTVLASTSSAFLTTIASSTPAWSSYSAVRTALAVAQRAVIANTALATQTLTHNLGTRNISVTIVQTASPYGMVRVPWEATTTNTVTLYFGSAPTAGDYNVIIDG